MSDNVKEAELARVEHSNFLRKKGAHAISVEKVPIHGRKRFAVIAHFADLPKTKLPSALTVKTSRGEAKVPLLSRKEEAFQLQ
jgi:hypothetical protein